MLFASKYQMEFKRTSRRDDLIALFYLLIYLLNEADLPGLDWTYLQSLSEQGKHNQMYQTKGKHPLTFWAQKHENFDCTALRGLAQELEKYGYSSEPNYAKLKYML
jgi:hypothetical protein